MRLASWVANKLANEEQIDYAELIEQATQENGGTFGEGAYELQQAFDAVEVGGNLLLPANPSLANTLTTFTASQAGPTIQGIHEGAEQLLPTKSRRDAETIAEQQFSTPLHYAYFVNWVANLTFKNHPFSSDMTLDTKDHVLGATIVEEALKLFPPGGRLVAIVYGGAEQFDNSKGMAFDGSMRMINWWQSIGMQYNVLANVGVSGQDYTKFGTTVNTRLLVIDKTLEGQQAIGAAEVVTGEVDHVWELPTMLEEVRNARTPLESQGEGIAGDAAGRGEGRVGGAVQPDARIQQPAGTTPDGVAAENNTQPGMADGPDTPSSPVSDETVGEQPD